MDYRRDVRRQAIERADRSNDGPIVPVIEFDRVFYLRPPPRAIADLDYGLISGSSGFFCQGHHSARCQQRKVV